MIKHVENETNISFQFKWNVLGWLKMKGFFPFSLTKTLQNYVFFSDLNQIFFCQMFQFGHGTKHSILFLPLVAAISFHLIAMHYWGQFHLGDYSIFSSEEEIWYRLNILRNPNQKGSWLLGPNVSNSSSSGQIQNLQVGSLGLVPLSLKWNCHAPS